MESPKNETSVGARDDGPATGSSVTSVANLGSVRRTKLIELGRIDAETRGNAGGTPDFPFPNRDTTGISY
jgi:hypothetical protein